MNTKYSTPGNTLTKGFESCKLIAYLDSRGIWTIGWGHTGSEVCKGLVWTQEQADAQLPKDEQIAIDAVNVLVKVPLTQGEFDALVDFVFNAGGGNFRGSTLLKKLNAGDYKGAAAEFDRWDHAGAQVVAGLLRRREAETQEFNG
jgi:lysozyme